MKEDYVDQMNVEGRFHEVFLELSTLCQNHLKKENAKFQDKYVLKCLMVRSRDAQKFEIALDPLVLQDFNTAALFLIDMIQTVIIDGNWKDNDLYVLWKTVTEYLKSKFDVESAKEK